ncbi:MAG TPA: OmpA family protein [Alphaproteobacteria bacterium]|nr:OmpA family protein [Alphaproteobacteria bacterium]
MSAPSAAAQRISTSQARSRRSFMLATAAAMTITGFAGAPVRDAAAQDQATASGGGLEEIVVTARRREEKLQSVPIAITAFTAADIRSKNINTAQDLTVFVPSLIMNNNAGFGSGFSLRGQTASLGAGSGVVAYFAEVPLVNGQTGIGTFQGGTGPGQFYDLENVQVLNGPQGTLFGRNTTGGAILFTPAKPTNNFEGYAQVTLGSYNWHEFEAAVNVPIVTDKVLLRLAGDVAMRDGYTTDVGPGAVHGKDYSNRDYWGFRASLVLRPSDDFENVTIFSSLYRHENGPGVVLAGVNPTGALATTVGLGTALTYLGQQNARGPRQTENSPLSGVDKEWDYGVYNISRWDVADNVAIKNIAAWQVDKNSAFLSDFDGSPFQIQDVQPRVGEPWTAASRQYSDELQFSGKAMDDRLQWTIGGYLEYSAPTTTPEFDVTQLIDVAPPTPPPAVHVPFYIPALIRVQEGSTQRSQAAYGQLTYDFGGVAPELDGLKLTLGYRYTWDYRSDQSAIDIPTFGYICALKPGLSAPNCGLGSSGNFHAPTWTAGLDYQITPETLLYVKGSRGYKSGGFNLSTPKQSAFASFKPEYVTDIELGVKSDWEISGVKLRTDLDLFHDDYSNIQRSVTQIINGLSSPVTENAAAATIQGVEFQGTVIPVAGTEISLAYSFIAAKYDSFIDPLLGSRAGLEFPFVPKNKVSVTAKQEIPIPVEWGDLSLSATYSYQSHYKGDNSYADVTIIQGYGLLNLRADWRDIFGQPLDVSFFATNVTDELYVTKNFGLYDVFGVNALEYGEPQMFGAQIRYHFGGGSEPEAAPAAYVPPPVVAPAPAPKSYLVFFDFNKSDLTPQAREIVDTAAKNASANNVTQLTVTGHTDTVGSDAYNMRLSRRRAESVAAQLEKDGVPSSEIAIVAKGKRDLLVPTADGVREPQNRRVQIVFDGGASS